MANKKIINSLNYGDTYIFTTPYGVCSTAAGTAAKAVTIENFALETGARITVKFTYTNTVASPTLNVNSTGAKAIYWHGAALPITQYWKAGAALDFVYNGTQWDLIGVADISTLEGLIGDTKVADQIAAAIPDTLKNPNFLTVQGNGTQSFTYDGSDAKTLNIKAGTNVSVSSDTSGNITISSTDTNTDTKVTAVGNHYTPAKSKTISASSTTAATWGSTDMVTGIEVDAAGHVTGVTSIQMPSNPNSDTNTTYDLAASASSTNGNVKLNLTAGGSGDGTDSVSIKGSGATTVTTDSSGVIIISSTDNNTVTTATTSGSGNAVTSVTASNGALTVTKGETFATKAQLDTVSGLVGDTAVATQIENAVSAITPASIGAATTSHASSSGSKIGTGTADVYGHVKLSNSVQSTYSTGSGYAATPSAVKEAYDLAFGKADKSHTHTVSNITDLTATATELNYMDGVTSNVQTQLDYCLENINYNSEQISLNADNILSAIEVAKTYSDERLDEEVTAIEAALNGKAAASHGNHVPAVQTASNKVFLRNDNTWQTITPANIGAAASSHTHSYLPLSGGTLTGNLTIGSATINSGSGQTVGLKVNRMWHFGDNVEATVINKVSSTYALCPSTTKTNYLGSSSYVWKQLYASTTTINTSDKNQKRDINDLDDKYVQLFDLVRPTSYYLINGDRVHTGFIAQEVEDAMTQVGLTAEELGFFCRDIKTEPVYDEDGEHIEDKEVYDEDGNPVYVYGLRYSEYIAVMAAKIKKLEFEYNSKLEELEKRLEALEA